MKKFEEKKFNIPTLKGLSAKNIEEHLKLYAGYVKNTNGILEMLGKYHADMAANSYVIGELHRRLSFEYNGMRNHELYFSALEGGAKSLSEGSVLKKAIETEAGSFDGFLAAFKNLAATTRGVGWAVLWYDPKDNRFLGSWIDEQHLGQLNGAAPILMLDMWEHAYVADYQPSGKKNYIEDFFANLNWRVIEENFKKAAR
ncbi:MAG: superoxide dismutase [Candidatus Taylorbacteria bacterium]|nr:superoxide dismutase [Candidatus Taylorbacteria bacterium]